MKYNLCKVDLHNRPKLFGKWWKWEEICDNCGEIVDRYNVLESKSPDFSKIDLCYDCMRMFIDKNISYEDVVKNIREKNK